MRQGYYLLNSLPARALCMGCVSALKATALTWWLALCSDISAELTASLPFSQGLGLARSFASNPETLHSILCVHLCRSPVSAL